MNLTINSKIKWASLFSSLLVFILSFLLFYDDNQKIAGSLSAALLCALLFWISFIMLSWIARVFTK
ncbi:MAG: hypothetical protein H0V82_10560 [Candidatus Protochlamydia sp.]|nr:hypothetical protein [Candidatus Protochlamydia sp.]